MTSQKLIKNKIKIQIGKIFKGQVVNILGVVRHMVFVATTQFCPYRMKVATNNV